MLQPSNLYGRYILQHELFLTIRHNEIVARNYSFHAVTLILEEFGFLIKIKK